TLNREIVDLALFLSKFDGSELHIAHAWEAYGESVLSGGRGRIPQRDLSEYVAAEHSLAVQGVEKVLSPFGSAIQPQHVHLAKGTPETVVPDLVKKLKIHLVVMGTLARTGVPGLLIGNTAEKILGQLQCSVLAVKPEGFVTPVTLPKRAKRAG